MTKTKKYQAEGSGWSTASMIEQNINVSKYKSLSGSNYINLLKELNHSRKGFINIQNVNVNKRLKRVLIRCQKNWQTFSKNYFISKT